MAKASVTIFVNERDEEHRVRTFGGNASDVYLMRKLYENMTKEEFIVMHPKFADKCKRKFKLYVV